jgi:hypothetical protein
VDHSQAVSMIIKIELWIVPVFITVILLCIMFRPYRSSGQYDFGQIFRLFWLIPIGAVWIIYMGILLIIKEAKP